MRDQQDALLTQHAAALIRQEQALYAGMLGQVKADAAAKHYQKDDTSMTMKERIAARERRDAMLRASNQAAFAAAASSSEGGGGGTS